MSELFSILALPEAQLTNLESLGYHAMTPIQAAALPAALNGQDIIGQAKTGSGKTAVFALGILAKLDLSNLDTQALILCPTRELSIQVATEIRRLARFRQNIKVTIVYGGQPISLQKQSLKHGAHIVVGTPGRVKDHLEKGTLNLNRVSTVVLDEADRMLEMGFIDDIGCIIGATPSNRQTLFFSATFPDNIQLLSREFQRDPVHIRVDNRETHADIEQRFYVCAPDEKLSALTALLAHEQPAQAVVFCNFKQTTRDICEYLTDAGYNAMALNGDLEQREREEILIRFKHQSVSVLVATDVAARGLDIKDLPAVINYELPKDPEIYVHRIGRTGRAGKTGTAITLCSAREQNKVRAINEYLNTNHVCDSIRSLSRTDHDIPAPEYVTFSIAGGRKDKLRPGEILGTLTGDGGIDGKDVGKIDVMEYASYVAVRRQASGKALAKLKNSKIKKRSFRVRKL